MEKVTEVEDPSIMRSIGTAAELSKEADIDMNIEMNTGHKIINPKNGTLSEGPSIKFQRCPLPSNRSSPFLSISSHRNTNKISSLATESSRQ